MKKPHGLMLCTLVVCLSACQPTAGRLTAPPITFPKIDRRPPPLGVHGGALASLPTYDPNSNEIWQVDLRGCDLSALDLRNSLNDLLYADFDTHTSWPPADRMPQGFDWERILDLGKNPGLGVRRLHAQGITGRDVGIAIIDQTLLVDHQEYAERLHLYEEMDDVTGGWQVAQMHGPAVASIAVGKTVGVAPDADLYYIAHALGGNPDQGKDFTYLARAIRRVLQVNEQLPEERKIRVLSMSVGWGPEEKGYDEVTAAAQEARAAGLLVVSSNTEQTHGLKFNGLGRFPLADPDIFESYEPGLGWAQGFYAGERFSDRLLVPMDSRTTAGPGGADETVFYRWGGWSWSIPYIAGLYALAVQVDPAITPERFWSLAMQTGRTIELKHEGQTIPLGPIIDPPALIEALQRGD